MYKNVLTTKKIAPGGFADKICEYTYLNQSGPIPKDPTQPGVANQFSKDAWVVLEEGVCGALSIWFAVLLLLGKQSKNSTRMHTRRTCPQPCKEFCVNQVGSLPVEGAAALVSVACSCAPL